MGATESKPNTELAEHHQKETQKFKEQVQQLQKDLTEAQIEAAKEHERKLMTDEQAKLKEQELAKAREEAEKLKKDSANVNVSVAKAPSETDLAKANAKVEEVQALNAKLTERIEVLSADITKNREKAEKLGAEREIEKQEVQKLKSRLETSESDLVKERKKLADLTQKFDELSKQHKYETVRHLVVTALDKEASAKFTDKRYEEAIELWLQVIGVEKADRKDASWLCACWGSVSACWDKLKRPEKALQAVEKALEYNPKNALSLYNRAAYHEKLGDRAGAVADAKRSLALNPNHPRAKDAQTIITRNAKST